MGVWDPWLKRSKLFSDYAKKDLAEGRYDSSSFFAQQSAEMLLKGLLLRRTGARPYTHSIAEMLRAFSEHIGSAVPEDVSRCSEQLEQHYIQARYPDVRIDVYRKWEAEGAIECLRRVVEYVRGMGEDI